MKRAIALSAVCIFIAAWWTMLIVGLIACTKIGFVGIPITLLIFSVWLVVVACVMRLALREG
jgi:hypothetical protein